MNTKLVKMLQHAYAAETAAYLAYEGHWRSLKDPVEAHQVKMIQADELKHLAVLHDILTKFGHRPSLLRTAFFTLVGYTASALCYVTGWYMPMWGAALIERIGVNGYHEMAKEAQLQNHLDLSYTFMDLQEVEFWHEQYFKNKLVD